MPDRRASFEFTRWEIIMEYWRSEDFQTDPEVQARFVHEYVHYLESLMGTLGRVVLTELFRMVIYARQALEGFNNHSKTKPPRLPVLERLKAACSRDFDPTELPGQYAELYKEILFTMYTGHLQGITRVDNENPFETRTHEKYGYPRTDFVFIRGESRGRPISVPLTERILFDNVARQVQRNYLRNNTGRTSTVDELRSTDPDEFYYVCLTDLIERSLPKRRSPIDSSAWAIAICQYSLLCDYPDQVFRYLLTELRGFKGQDLTKEFLENLKTDRWIRGHYNNPPLEEVLAQILTDFGDKTCDSSGAGIECLINNILTLYTDLDRNVALLFGLDLTWERVKGWASRYGCPPVVFADGIKYDPFEIGSTNPWHTYLSLTYSLLYRKDLIPRSPDS